MYNDFSQIDIPNPEEFVAAVNEHALLDFQRWFAEEAADYIRFQAGVLRRHTSGQWITTNFMHTHREVYPPLSGKDLDIITWTIYPAHGNPNEGPLGFRLGDGTAMSFMGDFARSINGLHGVMELQPGQVNWGAVNPQPYPGAVRNWILRAFALGARILCTYRYRQPLVGNEQYHAGIVGTDGVTLSRGRGRVGAGDRARSANCAARGPQTPSNRRATRRGAPRFSTTSTTGSISTTIRRRIGGTRWAIS